MTRARSRKTRSGSGSSGKATIGENNCTNIVLALLGQMIPLGNHCFPAPPQGPPPGVPQGPPPVP